MSEQFPFDVFLSHSSKDKAVVREVADRLRADGLKVWLDDWEIRPGESIPARIEEGLEESRVLVLCMSANAFGSDWAKLEADTFRFRDPLNKERRFVPVRLDDAPIKGSLAQFLCVDLRRRKIKQTYAMFLEACRPPAHLEPGVGPVIRKLVAKSRIQLSTDENIYCYALSPKGRRLITGGDEEVLSLWNLRTGRLLMEFRGHHYPIWSVDWSAGEDWVISASADSTLRLWGVNDGHCQRVLRGQSGRIMSVALDIRRHRALSGTEDNGDLWLWDLRSGLPMIILDGHTSGVQCLALSPDRHFAISGSADQTVRLWDVEKGKCLRILEGHTSAILTVEWSANQDLVLSGGADGTIRLWDVRTGRCLHVLEGHVSAVNSVAFRRDQHLAVSCSRDKTVRLWDLTTGHCLRILKGHDVDVRNVVWSADGRRAYSGDRSGCVHVWDLSEFPVRSVAYRPPKRISPSTQDHVQYTNAKVLLVGDSGVGKTGLANRLAHDHFEETDSTDGSWATQWILPHDHNRAGSDREVWLWDFAGQVDYRLVHQLFMDEAAAAVFVFNPQSENPYSGLGQWDRDLQKAARKPYSKLVAAGRIDRGGLIVSRTGVERFMAERGFALPLHETSAKTGEGCDLLRSAIVNVIAWENLPETTSPALYHRMKQEILRLRDQAVLIRRAELKQHMELTLVGEPFDLAQLETVVDLLAGPGMIQRLDFGGFILLRPEVLSRYAAAVVRKVRRHPQEMGCIREDELLAGDLDYQDFKRLPPEDESVVLRTLLETFVSRAWCLRQPCDGKAILTFPSYFRRERKEQPSHPSVLVTYRFDGPSDDIYATLVVRLHHTVAFESADLWRSAADFRTQAGAALGFTLTRESEGTSRLEVYFEPAVVPDSRVLFLRYVHEHLAQHAQNVVRLRHYGCGDKRCDSYGLPFTDRSKIDKALAPAGKGKVFCPDCGKPILLRDLIEEKFLSPAVKEQVRVLQMEGQAAIDNESRELLAVHHTGFIVAEAGQIYRGYTNSDHGIDGEIEFKDDQGRASGRRLYVQLKSGDSYLKLRQRDGAEVFQIKNPRWVDYWQQQAYAVMLVIRTSDGEIRWMDVSDYLRRASTGGKAVRQIAFEGERLDVMSVRRWRDRFLAGRA